MKEQNSSFLQHMTIFFYTPYEYHLCNNSYLKSNKTLSYQNGYVSRIDSCEQTVSTNILSPFICTQLVPTGTKLRLFSYSVCNSTVTFPATNNIWIWIFDSFLTLAVYYRQIAFYIHEMKGLVNKWQENALYLHTVGIYRPHSSFLKNLINIKYTSFGEILNLWRILQI
jgi:hypothetical protein